MKLSRKDVLYIARLARLGLTEGDVEKFGEQLSNLLENFEVLQQAETTGVPPTSQSIDLQTVMRDDEVAESLTPDQVLANAPRKEGGFFKIQAVLE